MEAEVEEEESVLSKSYNFYGYNNSSKKEKNEAHRFVQMQTKLGGDILNKYIKESVVESDYMVVGKDVMEYIA